MINLPELHYQIQKGMFFSDKFSSDSYDIYYSNAIDDIYWNYAVVSDVASLNTHFNDICEIFTKIGRKVCFYLNFNQSSDLRDLQEHQIKVNYSENWLRYDGRKLENPCKAKLVETSNEREDFMKVFLAVNSLKYGGPQASDSSIHALRESFDNSKYSHHITYEHGKPVSIATLGTYNGYCMIYNLATLPEFRGKGYTLSVVHHCVEKFKEIGGKELYIQTPHNSDIEKWYLGQGFKKVFAGLGLSA